MPRNDSNRDWWLVKLAKLLAVFPLPVLYILSDSLFLILFYLLRYQRTLLTENLRGAFPEYSSQAINLLARTSYRNAVQVLFEIIKSQRLSRDQLMQRARFVNPSAIQKFLDAGQSVLILTAHQCNWEWSQLACSASFNSPVQVVYKPISHPQLDNFLGTIRKRFGSQMIPVGNSLTELLKNRTQPKLIALAADLGPRPDEKKAWYKFMGRDTAYYPGAGLIARRLKAPVVFAAMTRSRRGFYDIRFKTLADATSDVTEEQIMTAYVQALESTITKKPADWLWLYKRWKYPKPESGPGINS